ncbi:helix-turn-helix transcriptional regulator [Clostridiaceae bacterium M8S5]|nr:helix-turn-helix transcriptional regulator [Clostridiaceae bacterium M8S5]
MFDNRLKDLRKEKGIEAQHIAKLLNVSKSTYSYYENNKSEPNYETLKKIADIFNVSIDYLLGRVEHKNATIIEDIPKELKELGVEYLEVTKELKEKGLTPQKIKSLIEGLKNAGLIKNNND